MKCISIARLVASAMLLAACSEDTACTAEGCGDLFSWTFELPSEPGENPYADATVELCRNDECLGPELPNFVPGRSTYVIRLDFGLPSDATGPDVYTATVRDAEGTTLYTKQTKVEAYEPYYPNGEECPPACNGKILDETED